MDTSRNKLDQCM